MEKTLSREDRGPASHIRTPDQRLRVFVSSTVNELGPERRVLNEAIEAMHLHPVLFELGARPYPPRDLYSAYLAQSHIFVAVYWESYGWVAPDMEISGIEDEYLLAADHPKLVYVKDPAPERDPRLADLLRRIGSEGVSYKKFSDADELGRLLKNDLAILLTERFEESVGGQQSDDGELDSHLVALVNQFVGRNLELAELERLFGDERRRLVTLVGPGGVGKSRLALEFAARNKDRFRDGAHFVALEVLSGPALVVPTILHTLGIQETFGGDPLDVLVRALCDRNALLILDNFEHVLEAAPSIARLEEGCSDLRVLVTSRRPLQLRGEIEVPLEPLSIPELDAKVGNGLGDATAVQLFVARAKEINKNFELSEDDAQAIAQICRELDGLPLALELAAARTRLLPPKALAERLEDRFDLLKGGPLDFPDRHQTLKATIDWSFNLLSPEDQKFFRRCSVFWGGWTLGVVEDIFDPDGGIDVMGKMQTLLEDSLVRRVDDSGEPRFAMLESVRRYAWDQLVGAREQEEIKERYARYFLDLIEQAHVGLRGPGQIEWMDRLDADVENFRGALRWCLDHDQAERVADTGWSIWIYWWSRNRLAEGRLWMEAVLDSGQDMSLRARGRAKAVNAAMALWQGDPADSLTLIVPATEELRAVGDDEGLGLAQLVLGILQAGAGDTEGALETLADSRSLLRKLGDDWSLGHALNATSMVANAIDSEEIPDDLFEEAVVLYSKTGDQVDTGLALANLGRRLVFRGRLDEGKQLVREGVGLLAEGRVWSLGAYAIEFLAEIAMIEGDYARAARIFGSTHTIREGVGYPPEFMLSAKRARLMEEIRAHIGDDATREACDIGMATSFSQAVDFALGSGLSLSNKPQ